MKLDGLVLDESERVEVIVKSQEERFVVSSGCRVQASASCDGMINPAASFCGKRTKNREKRKKSF